MIDAYPALDHLAMIEQVTVSTGGPGLNMAVDLRLLGATFPVGILGAVGDDEHGAFVAAECARLGIDTTGAAEAARGRDSRSPTPWSSATAGGGRSSTTSAPTRCSTPATADLEASSARILHAGAPGVHAHMDARLPGGGNGWSALLRAGQAAGLHTNLELVSLEPRAHGRCRPALPALRSTAS